MPAFPRIYQSLWDSNQPAGYSGFTAPETIGLRLTFAVAGIILGMRYFRDTSDGGNHIGWIGPDGVNRWDRVYVFKQKAAGAQGPDSWQNAYSRRLYPISAGQTINIYVYFENGRYWRTPSRLHTADYVNGNIRAPVEVGATYNGWFTLSADLGARSDSNGNLFGIDVLFWKKP